MIKQLVNAPPLLIKLIEEEYSDVPTIQTVIIGADLEPFNTIFPGKLGAFIPETSTVIIDLAQCMRNMHWMDKGMAFVANVWCNIIDTVFHEGAHARQMMNENIDFSEDTWDSQCDILDNEAEQESLEKMIDWFDLNNRTPHLSELGWVGQEIHRLFNHLYSSAPDEISAEMDIIGTDAGGYAEKAARNPYFEDEEAFERLLEGIDTNKAGLIVNGQRCLKIGDILEITALNDTEYRATSPGYLELRKSKLKEG